MYAILRFNSENLLANYNCTVVKVMDTTSFAEAEEYSHEYLKANPYLIGKGVMVIAHMQKAFGASMKHVKIESVSLESKICLPAPPIIDADNEMKDEAVDQLNKDKDDIMARACKLPEKPNKLAHLAAKKAG